MDKVIHLSGLNGLRAIAAVAVVISHIVLESNGLGLRPFLFGANAEGNPNVWLLANYGVTIFFCLSGFLITYLLLFEKEAKGQINIKSFYLRRLLRIWPLYYLYLLIALIILFCFQIYFDVKQIFFYIFFAANVPFILSNALVFLAHYWSIGVEEQFYLIWPWVANRPVNKILKTTCLITVILIVLKLFFWILQMKSGLEIPYKIMTVTRFQCMLIGGIGAILYYKRHPLFLLFSTNIAVQIGSWLVLLLVSVNRFHASALGDEIISIITVFIIVAQATKKNLIINLDLPIFNFIGRISYGIYIIHPLVIFFYTKVLGNMSMPFIIKYIIVFGLILSTTIFLAYLSYRYYEKRFLIIKDRFSVVKSSNARS